MGTTESMTKHHQARRIRRVDLRDAKNFLVRAFQADYPCMQGLVAKSFIETCRDGEEVRLPGRVAGASGLPMSHYKCLTMSKKSMTHVEIKSLLIGCGDFVQGFSFLPIFLLSQDLWGALQNSDGSSCFPDLFHPPSTKISHNNLTL